MPLLPWMRPMRDSTKWIAARYGHGTPDRCVGLLVGSRVVVPIGCGVRIVQSGSSVGVGPRFGAGEVDRGVPLHGLPAPSERRRGGSAASTVVGPFRVRRQARRRASCCAQPSARRLRAVGAVAAQRPFHPHQLVRRPLRRLVACATARGWSGPRVVVVAGAVVLTGMDVLADDGARRAHQDSGPVPSAHADDRPAPAPRRLRVDCSARRQSARRPLLAGAGETYRRDLPAEPRPATVAGPARAADGVA